MQIRELDTYLMECIDQRMVPGAIALVGRGEEIFLHKAYGHAAWIPQEEPLELNTRYDMASLTKVCATLPCVLKLVADGQVDLEDPISKYLDVETELGTRTVRMLLTHTAGLAPFYLLYQMEGTPASRLAWLKSQPPENPPGKVVYSDVGFVLLGELLKAKTGLAVDELAKRWVYEPLGMKDTGFCPKRGFFAATEVVDGKVVRGSVHDENCASLGGVAGHAGLFSTAADAGRYARAYLAGQIIPPALVEESFKEQAEGRGLGWVYLRPGLCWHTGFTGTALWLEADTQTYAVLLTNRVHPTRANQATQPMRAKLRALVFEREA